MSLHCTLDDAKCEPLPMNWIRCFFAYANTKSGRDMGHMMPCVCCCRLLQPKSLFLAGVVVAVVAVVAAVAAVAAVAVVAVLVVVVVVVVVVAVAAAVVVVVVILIITGGRTRRRSSSRYYYDSKCCADLLVACNGIRV